MIHPPLQNLAQCLPLSENPASVLLACPLKPFCHCPVMASWCQSWYGRLPRLWGFKPRLYLGEQDVDSLIGRTWNRCPCNGTLVPKEALECTPQGMLCRGVESELQSMFGENKGAGYRLTAYSLLRGPGQETFLVPVVV